MIRPILLPFLWIINGFLALIYLLADHFLVVLLVFPLLYLSLSAPSEQRPWSAGALLLSILASAFSPQPVPLLLLLMALAGVVALRLERIKSDFRLLEHDTRSCIVCPGRLGFHSLPGFPPCPGEQ